MLAHKWYQLECWLITVRMLAHKWYQLECWLITVRMLAHKWYQLECWLITVRMLAHKWYQLECHHISSVKYIYRGHSHTERKSIMLRIHRRNTGTAILNTPCAINKRLANITVSKPYNVWLQGMLLSGDRALDTYLKSSTLTGVHCSVGFYAT